MTVKVFNGKTGTPPATASSTPTATPTPPPSPLAPDVPESNYKHPAVDIVNGGCCGFVAPQFFDKPPVPNLYMGQAPPIISQQPMYSHNGMLTQTGYFQRQVR